jgi:PAS domain S-box-containing protein
MKEIRVLERRVKELERRLADSNTSLRAATEELALYRQAVRQQFSDNSLLLKTSFRTVEQGLAVTDQNMRLIACNRQFLDLHCYKGDMPAGGMPLIEVTLAFAKSGAYGPGDPHKLAESRIARLAAPDRPSHEQRKHINGRIIDIRRTTMPDGLTVSTYADITDVKEAEAKAEQFKTLLTEILDTVPASVALYDADRRLVFFNKATKRLFDWQAEMQEPGILYEDQIRDTLRQKMSLDAIGNEEEYLASRLKNFDDGAQNIETARPGGRWTLSSFAKTSDGSTVVIRYDISERKRTEQALRESEENFRNLFENSQLGISISRNEKLLFCNQAFAKIFGFDDTDDMMQISSTQLLAAPHDREQIAKYIDARTAGEPVPESYEFEGVRKDGGRIWLRRSARIVSWRGVPAIQGTIIDVTNRRRAEERLRKAVTDAEFANRSKSDFLAKMSHELRTPLNAIIGFSEVLKAETFGALGHEKYAEYVNDISASGHHLLDMINDILDMSKIEAGKYELRMAAVDPRMVVQETVQVVHAQIENNRLAVKTKFDKNVSTLTGDQRAIKQILLNLLSNAIKFTPENGTITVAVEAAANNCLDIVVTDTGIGIEPADIEKVLLPFNQVGSAQVTVHHGTGLGLPIVKSLVELHKGRMQISSEPGAGTAVRVSFPNHRPASSTSAADSGS